MNNFSDIEREFGIDELFMHLDRWAQMLPAGSTLIEFIRDVDGGWHIMLYPFKAGTAGVHIFVDERRGFDNESTHRKGSGTLHLIGMDVIGTRFTLLFPGRHRLNAITDFLTPICEGRAEERLWPFYRELHIAINGVDQVCSAVNIIPLAKLYYRIRGLHPKKVRQLGPWVTSNPEVHYSRPAYFRGKKWILVASIYR